MKATNIEVHLGGKEILHGVNFNALPSELTAIVGPNGSGKTTLLKAITGEIDYIGTVHFNGLDIKTLKVWELAAIRGVLPQINALSFPFKVFEVVQLGLRSSLSAANTDLPMRALEHVDLAKFSNRFYQNLSGGEQQRVQLARVLTQVWEPVVEGEPRWLLLDEPVASLDIGHQFIVMDIAREFAKNGGGVIAVLHDINLTAMYADKVVVMSEGFITASGSPADTISDFMLQTTYKCPIKVNTIPHSEIPFVLPQSRTDI